MLITNNLSVSGSLSLSSVSSTTTSLSAMVLESGLVKSRNLGTMSLKGDNEYLPQISLSFPNIFNLNTSTLNFANQSLTVSLANQPAKTFLAAPNNLAGTPSFRAILASDIPTLNQNTTGNAATATTLQTPRTLTIGNTGKSFDGSGNVSWSLAEIGAQSILTNPITGTGTTNYIPKFTSSGAIADSQIYDNGTNVGIGTTPIAKLDVNGDILLRTGIITGEVGSYTTFPLTHAIRLGIPNRDYMDFYEWGGVFNFYQNTGTPSLLMTIKPSGVGIGKDSPSEKLDVNGNVKANSYKFNLPSSISAQANMLIPKTDGTRPIWYDNSSVANDLAFKSDIDNIQIGGRNLLLNSKGEFKPQYETIDNNKLYTNSTIFLENGKKYIISAKTNGFFSNQHSTAVESDACVLWFIKPNYSVAQIVSDANTSTGTIFTWTQPTDTYVLRVNVYHPNSTNTIKCWEVKVEKGNKATDWTPAPEDKQDRLQDITGNIGVGKSDASATEKLDVNGYVKATGFKTSSGTSSQFLMADGSTNSNTYIKTSGGNTVLSDWYITSPYKSGKFSFIGAYGYPALTWGQSIAYMSDERQFYLDSAGFSQSDIDRSNYFSGEVYINNYLYVDKGLTINGSLNSGASNFAGYRQGGDNIVLKGNSTGVSGIFFQSEKDGTNINHPSDYGYIQFHAHGIDGTSGESNRLVIGVANDADDMVVLQSPYKNGVKISYLNGTGGTGGTEYTVWHAGNHGSGSGLDADLLDGQESTYFLNTSSWNAASLSYSGSTLTLTINGISKTTTINAGTSYTLPTASATTLGGVKLFSDTIQSAASNAVTTTASRTYGVQLNSSGQMVVNVPWVDTDTNTTYTAGNGLTLADTVFSLPITVSGSGNYITDVTQTANGITVTKGTLPTYNLPTANANTLGGVKIGSGITITNGVISANTYTAGTNITISSNQISVVASPTFSGSVTATSFFESSLRELKENIQHFEKSGLELVNSLEIVTFDKKDGSAKDKIGIIADDSPEEFLSEDKCAVDLYKTVFIQAKAIQELKSEVDELKELIKQLIKK